MDADHNDRSPADPPAPPPPGMASEIEAELAALRARANQEATAGLRFMETAAGRVMPTIAVHHALAWAGAAVLVLVIVAAFAAWAYWPAKPIPEVVTAAPQVTQDDGSVIAERALQASLNGKPAPHKRRWPPRRIPACSRLRHRHHAGRRRVEHR